jgi:hypothetical protein
LLLAPFARGATPTDVESAGYLLVFGELPNQTLAAHRIQSLPDVVERYKHALAADRQEVAAIAARAERDVFGPGAASVAAPNGAIETYVECVRRNLQLLAHSPQRYEAAIRAAYPVVIHRDAYPEEIAYWRKHGVVPYYLLLAAIENWARRNQPGLMVTGGTPTISINSSYLVTVQIAPAEAPQVWRIATGSAEAMSAAARGAVLAPGGDGIETNGGMYFVAAGR